MDPIANKNSNDNLAIDECLLTHYGGIAQWVVGVINITNKDIRLELVEVLDEDTLKNIITKHIMQGNNIYTDHWAGYNFISRIDSGYNHIRYNHSQGNFGYTSYIKSIWNEIKTKLKKLYGPIRNNNFVYYLRVNIGEK